MARGIAQEYLDKTVDPADDFYMFVNGGWMKSTDIPEDRSSWGSFHELAKNTDQKVLDILTEELERKGPAENKAARLFEAGMNTQQIEKAKLNAIQKFVEQTNALNALTSLPQLLGKLTRRGLSSLIHFSVHPDLGNSKIYSAYIEPGVLGLPEREFYLEQDEKSEKIREEYLTYIEYILKEELLYSDEHATEVAKHILQFETQLAEQMMPKEKRRQIELLYNPHTIEEIKNLAPAFNWNEYFRAMQTETSDYADSPSRVIVTEPDYIRYVDSLLNDDNLEILRHYISFSIIHHCAPYAT